MVRTAIILAAAALLSVGAALSISTTTSTARKKSHAPGKGSGSGTAGAKKKAAPGKKGTSGGSSSPGASSRSSRGGKKKGGKKVASKPVPRGQQAPTPERVKEIQKALIDRGYLQGEPSGVWGPESAEALKRFQGDKQLEATGKLSSLSLIHLGLGPKRDAPAQQRTEQKP